MTIGRASAFLAAFALAAAGAFPAAAGQDGQPALQEQAASLVAAYEKNAKAVVAVSVVDLKTGQQLAAIRQDKLCVPASNQKLLTSAFALARLGVDFQFTTSVYLVGKDIVIVGDYDPALGDARVAAESGHSIYSELDRWAAAIKKELGADPVGDILVCVRRSRRHYRHADWPGAQRGKWYAAPVAALNFNNNCLDVTFQLDKGRATPVISPATRFINIVNKLKVGPRHRWSLRSNSDDSVLTISGTIKVATTEALSVAVNDPPLLLGRALAERLRQCGLALPGKVRRADLASVDLKGAKLIAQTATPLGVVMGRANKQSLNMAAECMFLRAGDGSWDGSAKIMSRTLVENYGLQAKSFLVRDGGGLSARNRVSPEALTKLLSQMLKRPDAQALLASLPVSGVDGTMQKRLAEPEYRGRVLAKTGRLAGVYCLSGYVLGDDGKPALAFAILASGADARARSLQDQLCRLLVERVSAGQKAAPARRDGPDAARP